MSRNFGQHPDAIETFEKAREIRPVYAEAQKKPGDRTQAEGGKALNARAFTVETGSRDGQDGWQRCFLSGHRSEL